MQYLREWLRRQFSDPQVVVLALALAAGFAIVLLLGGILAPVLASVILAYLLEGLVAALERRGIARLLAVNTVFVLFLATMVFAFFGLLPLISRQAGQLVQAFPDMLARGQAILLNLPHKYPHLFSASQVNDLLYSLRAEVGAFGQRLIGYSMASVIGVITVAVYLFVVPLMVYFLLKDKEVVLAWSRRFLPRQHRLLLEVWRDVDAQVANYVRGKFIEILVVWASTYVAFLLFGLQFAVLLSALVGLSVLVPYVGAVAVTVPVAVTAFWQWGWGSEFAYLMIAFLAIQAVDGNLLVPLLFSEAVDLHPVAIMVAILFFGGLWGFWGVFFAIPLATLVRAVINAWPTDRPAAEAP